MSITSRIEELRGAVPAGVTLVAVSKTYPAADIMEAYSAGQRVFGESRPQELKAKHAELPGDIRWHMIGHLQTNKVKYVVPFVELIHSVDSERLLCAIDAEAAKMDRTVDMLLEVRIAREQTKHGWDAAELDGYLAAGGHRRFANVRIRGLMGIASLTGDMSVVRREFTALRECFERFGEKYFGRGGENGGIFDTLSMGMSADWPLAVECGSNMVRIGSTIFGARN